MRHGIVTALLFIIAVAACAAAVSPRASRASALLPVHVEGGKFIDSAGRERHFRGVNVVYKDFPFLPNVTAFDANLSFVEDDLDLLVSLGVNLVRLGVMWPGLFPRAGSESSAAYLEAVRKIVRMCEAKSVYLVLEPHQDEMSPLFCGEGFPDWWVDAHAASTNFPVPVQPEPFAGALGAGPTSGAGSGTRVAAAGPGPVPTRAQCDRHSSFSYIWTDDAARAYQTFYERGAGTGFARYWATVAQAFADEPAVIGGELFNEPFPGDVFGRPELRRNAFADRENLEPMYRNVTRAVRAAREDGGAGVPQRKFALAYEPSWPVGDQDLNASSLLPPTSGFTALPDPEGAQIYAFHYYTPPCSPDVGGYLDARLADARRLGGAAPFASELNLSAGSAAQERAMRATLRAFEERRISYAGWQYKSYSGSLPGGTCTGCGNSFFNQTDGAPNLFMQRAMARPLAQAVAGRTERIVVGADRYRLEFSLLPETGGSAPRPTVVVVPGLWTPGGSDFSVAVDAPPGATTAVRRFRAAGRALKVADGAAGVDVPPWTRVEIDVRGPRGAEGCAETAKSCAVAVEILPSPAIGATRAIAPGVVMPRVSLGHPDGPSRHGHATLNETQALELWLSAEVGGAGVDTALDYRNQRQVGAAVRAALRAGRPRGSIFLTTKIPAVATSDAALALVREDVAELALPSGGGAGSDPPLDLVLIHFPGLTPSGASDPAAIRATWRGLESALALGLTRAIGVSNFERSDLEVVLALNGTVPAVNQCQMSVGSHDDARMRFTQAKGIAYEAYSPFGREQPGINFADPRLVRIAEAHGVSVPQVCLRWIVQQDCLVAVSSTKLSHDVSDLALFGFALDDAEMAELSAMTF
jgi:endoglycosylceramidase